MSAMAKVFQCGLWFWVVVGLRFSADGSVAAGMMIEECVEANPELRFEDEVDGPSCNGPFTLKAGKVFFAWVIISVFMCK